MLDISEWVTASEDVSGTLADEVVKSEWEVDAEALLEQTENKYSGPPLPHITVAYSIQSLPQHLPHITQCIQHSPYPTSPNPVHTVYRVFTPYHPVHTACRVSTKEAGYAGLPPSKL